ncbi:hypothetical protein [Aquabacterium sp. OR-4]|uniref:hypothetical protein n=1 Tax=Aquabacterium sp. OR-4 TaxID=2978127 RepID=UPI0028CAA65C|nr:hypothetical protein [Aquabacterium sp. OR-4]MDT7836873.1 hypothetical protein [Aquabacterium sp. OR-4]
MPTLRPALRPALLPALLAAVVAGCGGGSDSAPDSLAAPDAQQLDGAPCGDCRPGVLSGQAASGQPLADAAVLAVAADGRRVEGRTDAQGRFALGVGSPGTAWLLQVRGQAGGRAVTWHALCRGAEVGTRHVTVTAISELVAAQVLGGRPAELLQAGTLDLLRVDADSLRRAEALAEAVLRPLLDAAGVAAAVDLRVTAFSTDRSGLDLVLELLDVQPHGAQGYRLRHAGQPSDAPDLVLEQAQQLALAAPLPAMAGTAARRAADTLAELEAQLRQWTAWLAPARPDRQQLLAELPAGFRDGGLDASGFVDRVLLRQDPADEGGWRMAGARWSAPRLLAQPAADRALLQWQVSPSAPQAAYSETMWWQRHNGRWQPLGDGAMARVQWRALSVLGPQPLAEAAVRSLPGFRCPTGFDWLPETDLAQRCHLLQPALGGVLDAGRPGDGLFGSLALHWSLSADPALRLQAQGQHSQLLGQPSQGVSQHLALQIDARRVDARARSARLFGAGLPADGVLLVPPPLWAGRPLWPHWALADADGRARDDWQALPLGWCDWAADTAAQRQCQADWATLAPGRSWQLRWLDAQGQTLGEQAVTLPLLPRPQAQLQADPGRWFARWQPTPASDTLAALPALNAVLDDRHAQALALQWPALAPAEAGLLPVEAALTWWRAPWPGAAAPAGSATAEQADGDDGDERVHRRLPAAGADGRPAALHLAVPERSGWRGRWLAARLVVQDSEGRWYLHFLAPNNPR